MEYLSRSVLLAELFSDFSESGSLFPQILDLLRYISVRVALTVLRMCVLTIFSTLLCLVQLVLVCSLVVLAEQFAKFPVSWIWQPEHDGKLSANSPEKVALGPDDTVDRFTRRSSDSADWERLGRGLLHTVIAFRLVLFKQLSFALYDICRSAATYSHDWRHLTEVASGTRLHQRYASS